MMFTSDLRKIREKRGLKLEGLHEETKIPLSVLEEFEETGLFDNPMFNRVYLRSLVRTYAVYIEIPTKTVMEALDEALLDSYQGSLGERYLRDPLESVVAEETAEPEETPSPDVAGASKQPAAPAARAKEAEGTTGEETAAAKEKTPDTMAVAQQIEDLLRAGKRGQGTTSTPTASGEASSPSGPAAGPPRRRTHPPLLTTAEAAWDAQSPGPRRRRRKPVDVKRRAWYTHWMVIVVAVVGFAGAIWALLVFLDRPDDTAGRQVAVVDTTAVDTTAVDLVAEPARPKITLGDTLYVVVLATEKVERILIRRDDDLRRAYWIEEGVAKAFPAMDRIVFENRLNLIRLYIEGYEYPTALRDEADHVVITRQSLQAFADTLTVSPVELPAPPDTIPLYPAFRQ